MRDGVSFNTKIEHRGSICLRTILAHNGFDNSCFVDRSPANRAKNGHAVFLEMRNEVIVTVGVEPVSVETGENFNRVAWQLLHGADRALVGHIIGEVGVFVAKCLKVP